MVRYNAHQHNPKPRMHVPLQTGMQGLKAGKPKQHSFMSALYIKEQPVTSKQPVDMGMRDVTMGVLCSSSSSGMVYRARWRKRSVSVKVR